MEPKYDHQRHPWISIKKLQLSRLSQDTPVVAHEPIHLAGTYKLCIRDFAILCEWNYQVGADVIHAAIFDEGLEELIEPSNLS